MPLFEKPGKQEPSQIGVLFFAMLMALIGAFAGFRLLASIPPKPFESVADYESNTKEYSQPAFLDPHYYRGAESPLNDWVQKREIFLAASNASVELADAEINAWIASKFVKPRKPNYGDKRPSILLIPGLPNVFINASDGISFSLLLEVFVFEKPYSFILICKGKFSEEAPIRFEATSVRLNEALLPLSEEKKDRLLNAVLKPFYESDEFIALKEAWENVESVELIDNRICLNLVHEAGAP